MADVYDYITSTGLILADTVDLLAEVIIEYETAFGTDLITTPNTPQGVLINAETLARAAVADNNAMLANQINPNVAGGVFLDAIAALTDSSRIQATSTVLDGVVVAGVAGTFIAAGSLAQESATQRYFATVADVTIGAGGTASVNFASVLQIPIAVAIGGLNTIVSNILGWETVSNPAVAILGQTQMSDGAFRSYRQQTLFAQGSSLAGAIVAAVTAVPNVQPGMFFQENLSPSTQVINGITMVGHSIYMCISGVYTSTTAGLLAVAEAIVSRKSAGAAYNNGLGTPQSQTFNIPVSGQSMTVLWDSPIIIPVFVIVTVSLGNSTYTSPTTAIIQAIQDYQNGLIEGQSGLTVGVSVSAFELAAAINAEFPGMLITNVQVGTAPAPTGVTVPILVYQQANIPRGNITVVIV